MEYGSGHIRPIHAADPGLVYNASYDDYLLFACASIGAQMDQTFPCPKSLPSTWDLNYPSMTVTKLNGSITVRRTVTNVGQCPAQYRVAVSEPANIQVQVSPRVLRFSRVGQRKSFSVKLKVRGTPAPSGGQYVAGSYTWTDGTHVVRSPIVVSFAA